MWEGGTEENTGQHLYCINFVPDKPCANFRTAVEEMDYLEVELELRKEQKIEP